MNNIELLILHGPPAAGKSTIAKAIASRLRDTEIKHAVIEMDDLAKIYPLSLLNIMYKNLAAMWPNYTALGDIKIIIPTYLQVGEREIVLDAAPAKKTTICEVTAPHTELQKRITHRESDPVVQERLLQYLRGYQNNRTPDEDIDFKVTNFNKSTDEIAQEITEKMGWAT